MKFSRPERHWTLLRLECDEYRGGPPLPDGFAFSDPLDRDAERALLQMEFPHWDRPFERRMPGAREDGVVGVDHEGKGVAVVYATEGNDLGIKGYGQITYAAMDPACRGRGVYAAMFAEGMRRIESWGLHGSILLPNREGHQEMYERWGAVTIGYRFQEQRPLWRRALGRLRRLFSR